MPLLYCVVGSKILKYDFYLLLQSSKHSANIKQIAMMITF